MVRWAGSPTRPRPGAAVLNSVISFVTSQMNRCIDGWRAGDRAAADELIRRTQNRFRQLAERMYSGFPNVRAVGEADDLFTCGWVRLLHSLKQIRPSNTKQFFVLAGVHLHRELHDMARSAKRLTYRARPLEKVVAGGESSAEIDVAEPAERTADIEMWERFHEGVGRLPADLREVVILRFYDGRSFTSIAGILGRNERTIRRWWEDACYQLRSYVEGSPARAPG